MSDAVSLTAGTGGMLSDAGFQNIETSIVHRETRSPHFQTVLAMADCA